MTASENTTFSTSEEDVISRRIDVQADRTADNLSSSIEFEEFYEIERIAEEIVKGGFKRVSRYFARNMVITVYHLIRFDHCHRWLSNFLTNYFMTPFPSIEDSKPELEKGKICMSLRTHPMAGRLLEPLSTLT